MFENMYEKKNQTVVCHYVDNIRSTSSHIDPDGIIQQHMFHSVLWIRHTDPGIWWVIFDKEDVI